MIDSPSNSIVKELQSLSLPKGRKEQGRFLAEGVRLVNDAFKASWRPTMLLFNADQLRLTPEGKELLEELTDARVDSQARHTLIEASERAIAAASSTKNAQGVVASFAVPSWDYPPKSAAPLVLICDDIQDPGNLGTILRSAEAAGVTAVFLTPNCVDLYNPKVVRAGMGAHFRLPTFVGQEWEQMNKVIARVGVQPDRVFATDAGGSQDYDKADWTQASAIIVSNEAHGLSKDAGRAAKGRLLSIPMHGGTESLNAAMAATVLLFEAARQRRESGTKP